MARAAAPRLGPGSGRRRRAAAELPQAAPSPQSQAHQPSSYPSSYPSAYPSTFQPTSASPYESAFESSQGTHRPARPAAPYVRGGHPEQHEPGGGWGGPPAPPAPPSPAAPTARGSGRAAVPPVVPPVAPPGGPQGPGTGPLPSPRQEYVDAFDGVGAPAGHAAAPSGRTLLGTPEAPDPYRSDPYASGPHASDAYPADPYASVSDWDDYPPLPSDELPQEPARGRSRKGMTFTGIAAAAVTTVLAIVVAGQVADRDSGSGSDTRAGAAEGSRTQGGSASRSDDRATPTAPARVVPLTYEQKMAKKYPLAADLKGSGAFESIPDGAAAPGKGEKFRYRVDVEKGLGLDAKLFADAVQKTLNDKRSWAHGGERTFERVGKGEEAQFVITLASPGTTADWCAKSGLDTTEDNVSCDSAATERVMINAYRWAQGAKPYDDALHDKAIFPYRQMLINHEVGHRLGFNHVTCTQNGAPAPVMQQQTKFLKADGITCRPNPWVFPKG
ncbi:DUF3152 domain-containing protein [Streptomyces xanthii]|uniref:DUF3152 domain-containing protein n=1 Tax=Streptomyces xanthii TaxID=2768069 RepID=A0A7H1BIW1_9ACTN|nr:DUF3152 domain-containing protein [Streptomyces xanthii]